MTDKAIEVTKQAELSLGALEVAGPDEMIGRATAIATALSRVVESRGLVSNISGKKYPRVEAWTTMGAMIGVLPREVPGTIKRSEDGSYEAYVELIRVNDGAVVGGASALCSSNEKRWANADEYARRSMAITRATGKAYRLGFAWIMTLAGYEGTPAEEMDFIDGQVVETKPKSNGNGAHWIDDPTTRKRFWVACKNDAGLTEAEVYKALKVKSIHEWENGKDAAWDAITAFKEKKHTGEILTDAEQMELEEVAAK